MTLHAVFSLFFALCICLSTPSQNDAQLLETSADCDACYVKENKDILKSPHDDISKCWNSSDYEVTRNTIFDWQSHNEFLDIATILTEIFKVIIKCADDICAIFKLFVQPSTNDTLATDADYRIYAFLKQGGTIPLRHPKRYDTPKEVTDILPLLRGIPESCLHRIIYDHRDDVEKYLNLSQIYMFRTTTQPETTHAAKLTENHMKTTTVTTPTTPIPPVTCAVCTGFQQCIMSPTSKFCGDDHLCYLTVVTQGYQTTHYEKGCKSISDCMKEWWHETSDMDGCTEIDDGLSGEDLTCTFCCDRNMCNNNTQNIIPKFLYTPA
ncbi:uncharacterized protein LOC121376132 [Gigantopelta aegis]|uniref:uncharacterized protein LOC121376132 n=1 Tax=Gigantopelta aegis TaxID=1735272 RepID=UPI001B88B41E|nr:uncharacterized protein LOC121376132 [Gigantopelta aegis]